MILHTNVHLIMNKRNTVNVVPCLFHFSAAYPFNQGNELFHTLTPTLIEGGTKYTEYKISRVNSPLFNLLCCSYL